MRVCREKAADVPMCDAWCAQAPQSPTVHGRAYPVVARSSEAIKRKSRMLHGM